MTKTAAEYMAKALEQAGVKRVYGVVGDSLNGFNDALRRLETIEWIHVRHEEGAAFAAGAEAHLTGKLAVCAGSCGPGNLHLINGLFECHRNRVPVLAIAAQIPSPEVGGGYFQETHPEILFRECSHYCELISQPAQMPRILDIAMRTALEKGGVAVIVLPGDVGLREAETSAPASWTPVLPPTVLPPAGEIEKLAQLLNNAERVTLLCGAGCRRARPGAQARRCAQVADRAHPARQGIHRARESVRRRHDRPDRLLLRLSRHARL